MMVCWINYVSTTNPVSLLSVGTVYSPNDHTTMTETQSHYVNTISEAIERVNESLEWSNGMATEPVTVERERSYLKVIRKCGTCERPEILLFKCVPKNGFGDDNTDYQQLSDEIISALGVYGDITVEFGNGNRSIKTAVVDSRLIQ